MKTAGNKKTPENQILAHGIDLVDFSRIENMQKRHGKRFINRVFTKTEQQYAQKFKNKTEKLAGRFAAKEAVLKLLGTGWRGKIAWTDIEIKNNHTPRQNRSWKCKRFCPYGKNTFKGTSKESYTQQTLGGIADVGSPCTICDQINYELTLNGIEETNAKYSKRK